MYRSTQNYENQQKMLFDGVGEYGIPQIEPHHTIHANSYHSTMRKAVKIEQIMEYTSSLMIISLTDYGRSQIPTSTCYKTLSV